MQKGVPLDGGDADARDMTMAGFRVRFCVSNRVLRIQSGVSDNSAAFILGLKVYGARLATAARHIVRDARKVHGDEGPPGPKADTATPR